MHSSGMYTACSLPYQGSLLRQRPPGQRPSDRDPQTETETSPVDRTDTCENVNLPQTSFAGGNKIRNFRYCHIFQNPLMHTTHSLPRQRTSWTETPVDRDPLDRDPLDRDPSDRDRYPLWTNRPL